VDECKPLLGGAGGGRRKAEEEDADSEDESEDDDEVGQQIFLIRHAIQRMLESSCFSPRHPIGIFVFLATSSDASSSYSLRHPTHFGIIVLLATSSNAF
jgi:hypothetical protein